MVVILPHKWRRQPTGPLQVNSGHALARSIAFAYSFSHTFDAVRREMSALSSGADPGYTHAGRTVNATGASSARVTAKSTGPILGGNVDLTIAAGIVTRSTAPANGGALYCERGSAGNDILKITTAANVFNAVYRNDGATLITVSGTGAMNNGAFQHAVIRKIGTAWTVWRNGVNEASGTFGSGSDAFTDASVESWIGCDKADTTNSQYNGHILYCYGWKRGLTAAEIAALYDNPWQFSRPIQRRIYVNVAAAGGGWGRHLVIPA